MRFSVRACRKQIPGKRISEPPRIDFPDSLYTLAQSGPAGESVCFQGRRDREADGFFRPAAVRDNQMRGQGIQLSVRQFHTGVERLEVDGNICPVQAVLPLSAQVSAQRFCGQSSLQGPGAADFVFDIITITARETTVNKGYLRGQHH